MTFAFFRLRFHFEAGASIVFAAGKSGNMLRGAFGSVFRQVACVPECTGARTCPIRRTCAYARTFEPIALDAGPSGLSDHPRPFVFRAAHLDGLTIPAGDPFYFDMHLFQVRGVTAAYFIRAFAQLARAGIGPIRAPALLKAVEQLDPAGSSMRAVSADFVDLEPSTLCLEPVPETVERIGITFLTPTELKSGQQLAARPQFGVLVARIRDRISTLSALYGEGPLDLDFAAFGRRAEQVHMTRCDLAQVDVTRVSSRTGQRHSIGGFTGEAEYEGALSEFVPFLRAAQFTGVGRQTTWGKGEIRIHVGGRP